ncbi:uncharacterized protein DSM5745_04029 [Aspergillus mulundensis]|uniref:Uncharacterized protein n=1 Tax=Aspergillus mulundensis TaxID=1810919 RepID=A0A3D8SBQ3_9EURO|nr:hypothetical protein DSM5745_04029 [Aspergillus mulundensis]RDW83703.1 hypothetical protein DSM5745_04029 [Aspergillus mulundensis]
MSPPYSRRASGGCAAAIPTLSPIPDEPEDDSSMEQEIQQTHLHSFPVQHYGQQHGNTQNEVVTTTSSESSMTSEGDTILPLHPRSRASTISTEPFPDLDESSTELPDLAYRAQEEAYKHALGKVAEEILRMNEINDHVTAIHGPAFYLEEEETARSRFSMFTLEGVDPCPEVSHHDHFCVEHEAHKRAIRERIDHFLKERKDVPRSFSRKFIAVTDMIMHMEYILFRGKGFPKDPLRYTTEKEMKTVFHHTTKIIEYLSVVGGLIFRERNNAEHARVVISQIAAKPGLTLLDRFKGMAEVVIQYLKHARPSEQTFFELFNEFFEIWLYDDFHVMYNNFLVEHIPNIPPTLQRSSYLLNAVYNMIAQMVRDYEVLGKINRDIGDRFIRPVVDQMARTDDPYGQPINEPAYLPCEPKHERYQSEIHKELASIIGDAQAETTPERHDSQSRNPIVLTAYPAGNESQDHAHGVSDGPSHQRSSADRTLHRPQVPRSQPRRRTTHERLGPSDVPLVYRSSPFIVSPTSEPATLARPIPIPSSYRRDLQSSHTVAQESHVFSSQSSYTMAAQSSSFGSHRTDHSGDNLNDSDTEYAPTEVMSSFEFNRCWDEIRRANGEASQPALSERAQHVPEHDDVQPPPVPRHAFLDQRLQEHSPTCQNETTHAVSVQLPHTEHPQEPEQHQHDDDMDSEILDLNAAEDAVANDLDDNGSDWLPHDHEDAYPQAPMNTFTARLEAIAHMRRQNSIDNGEYEDPANNVPSFAEPRPQPSLSTIPRSVIQFQYPILDHSQAQEQPAVSAPQRRVVERDDNNSPILPPMPEYPRFTFEAGEDENTGRPLRVVAVRPQLRRVAMPIPMPRPVTRRGNSSDRDHEREASPSAFIYRGHHQDSHF